MYNPPDEKAQPADEGTLMLPQGQGLQGLGLGAHPGSQPAIPAAPNAALLRTQLVGPSHVGHFGAKSAPEGVPIPGSQPPPGYSMQMAPGPQLPGSQLPGSQPPQGPPPDPRFMQQQQQVPSTGGSFRPVPAPNMGPPPVLLQGKPDSRMVLITEPDSARAVSFRLLRDNLLAKRLPRVLAVSSAAKKDGKTTCALNLALSLAERAKVLLIEGNLIDPELDKIFGISEATPVWPMNAGWLGPYRIAEFSRGLHVAAVVTYAGQPAPRFDKPWFEQVIGSLRRFPYDFIIIDAAAFSESPTVSQLVATADATLLAVRSGVTTARALRRATDQIPEGRAIGIALIDATIRP